MKNTLTFQLIKTGLILSVMVCLLAFWPLTASEKSGSTGREPTLITASDNRTETRQTEAGAADTAGTAGPTDTPAVFPVSLTDAAGRTVTLKKRPQRIVVIGRGPFMALHTMYMFPEAGDVIVGYENRASTIKDFISLINPRSADVVELGTNPGLEQIAALHPDLVIKKGVMLDKPGEMLLEAGIPIFYVALETPDLFFSDVRNFGYILGNSKRADEVIGYFQSRLDRFTRSLADLAETDKPGILVVYYNGRGNHAAMQVSPETWMQTIQVKYAGGRPVWLSDALSTSGWSIVNFEQIAAWNPDKIYVIFPLSSKPADIMTELTNNPLWKHLKAVESGNLRAFPSDIIGWDTPEPRWLLGMTWMALNTHPDRFPDLDMNREIDSFFHTLYGIDQSVIDAKIRPAITILGPGIP